MSEKWRDNRGRILRNGESQRQDGRYAYKYKDLSGDYDERLYSCQLCQSRRFWSSNQKTINRKLAEMLTHNLHTLPVELRRFMVFLAHLTQNK